MTLARDSALKIRFLFAWRIPNSNFCFCSFVATKRLLRISKVRSEMLDVEDELLDESTGGDTSEE